MPTIGHGRLRPHSDAIVEALEDELLLVHLGHGTTFRLNRTGKVIWELAAAGFTREQITLRFQTQFAIPPEHAQGDVSSLLDEFMRHHLLEWVTEKA